MILIRNGSAILFLWNKVCNSILYRNKGGQFCCCRLGCFPATSAASWDGPTEWRKSKREHSLRKNYVTAAWERRPLKPNKTTAKCGLCNFNPSTLSCLQGDYIFIKLLSLCLYWTTGINGNKYKFSIFLWIFSHTYRYYIFIIIKLNFILCLKIAINIPNIHNFPLLLSEKCFVFIFHILFSRPWIEDFTWTSSHRAYCTLFRYWWGDRSNMRFYILKRSKKYIFRFFVFFMGRQHRILHFYFRISYLYTVYSYHKVKNKSNSGQMFLFHLGESIVHPFQRGVMSGITV